MQDEADDALRLLAGGGLRLALRAVCARLPDDLKVARLKFAAPHALVSHARTPPLPDVLLAEDAETIGETGRGCPQIFARDSLLAASRPGRHLGAGDFLARLLDDTVRVAIAIPRADGGIGMIETFFGRCDQQRAGSGGLLRRKARLVAGVEAPTWGPRQVMGLLEGDVDVVLGPRSMLRSLSAVADLVAPPPALAVDISCGLVVLAESSARQQLAARFVACLLSQAGQKALTDQGFAIL